MTSGENNQRRLRYFRQAFLLLLVCSAVLAFVGWRWFLPVHPRFGAIYETTAYDLNEARSNRFAVFLRSHLPRRVLQSPRFPSRFKDQPRYLRLEDTEMEWSIGGTDTGWLYFWGIRPSGGLITGTWEFVRCAETNLLAVVNLPPDFCGSTDPRRTEIFGDTSTTNAIKVSVGQILFARETDKTNRIYILNLKEQHQNRLLVNYCVVSWQ